uniref:Reprolysin n=1 Tax=Rhipicephalus zambeziensis TaxID=60191 RepID=A0A224YPY1_9ACAR
MPPTYFCALFLIYAYATCGEEMQEDEQQEEVIRLGLYFVYDKAFSDRALFIVNDSYDAYFTALTTAAQEFFKQHNDPEIILTLVGSSILKEEDIATKTTTKDNKLNASETLDKLRTVFTWNNPLNSSVDVVFLATGKELLIRESRMTGEWNGLAYPRSICVGNATVGIIHDDGATFNGVRLTALQVALLLGANKDNGRWRECPVNEEEYLTSNWRGGRIPYLSDCSKASVRDFYYRVKYGKYDICWNDKPTPALEKNIGFPVDFYKLFDCDQCHVAEHFKNNTGKPINCSVSTINRNIDHWPSTTESPWHRAAKIRQKRWYRRHTTTVSPYKDCKQSCCRFVRLGINRGGYWDCWYTPAADGTVCDSLRVCLDGECA